MSKMKFNYHKTEDEVFNGIVEAFSELTMDFRAGKSKEADYAERNNTFSESVGKYCVEQTGRAWTGIDMLKNPQLVTNDSRFTAAFATVLAQAITPVVPAVTSSEYTRLYDVTQVGWGDAAKFTVDSNEYFIVNDLGEGIARQNQQTAYNTEYTVTASKKQIAVFVNWYQVVSGKFDWGEFGAKVAKSFEAYIQSAVIKAMTNAITNAASLGIAGYKKVGTDADTWIELKELVSAANNSDVYALGTLGALSKVVPEDAGFRFTPADDLVTVGYLPSYKQVPMIQLDQAIMPGTINTATPKLLVQSDYIFFIPMGFNKPVHVVFEGDNVVVSTDPLRTKDATLGLTVSMYIGIDTIVGSKFGILDVAD